jgi:hypothetical protein
VTKWATWQRCMIIMMLKMMAIVTDMKRIVPIVEYGHLKSGEIAVSAMDDRHLTNALNYVKNSNPDSPLQLMLENEINRRKQMIGTWDERQVTGEKPYKDRGYRTFKGIKPLIFAWAIRQKSTGAFLPARKNGRGYSFDEPSFDFPRLFKSELSASRALSAWLQGKWKREYHTREVGGWPEDVEYIISEKVEGRDPHDMEIVKFRLIEEGK